ncbi:hypothetical protein [Intrasporangium flavum]|uniref:hypothetical protein n=1 Tax=Intrasporangium flavum TaxID=1428657 RepID=UPI00096F0CC4|nr:hypothetical protein [Intrasporangium flavum]
MVAPFRLHSGDPVPVQQTSTTCGSASLTVARMLVNPAFAQWIRLGVPHDPAAPMDAGTETGRFAAYEQVVARRTGGWFGGGGRLQLPWPRALGTSPWGARNELRFGAGAPGARWHVAWFRLGSAERLGRAYDDLAAAVRPGRPGVLYIGSPTLPRHVVLALPPTGGDGLDVYEPSVGRVVGLSREAFVMRRLRLAGWDVPWAAVHDAT